MSGSSPHRKRNELAPSLTGKQPKNASPTAERKTVSRKKWGENKNTTAYVSTPTAAKMMKVELSPPRAKFSPKKLADPIPQHRKLPSYGQVSSASEYRVTLKVRYETQLGQTLYVMGNIPELGDWTHYCCQMTWTDDHVWVTSDLKVKKSHFMYKYVLKSEDETIWETGINRLADLKILPQLERINNSKTVEIYDDWE